MTEGNSRLISVIVCALLINNSAFAACVAPDEIVGEFGQIYSLTHDRGVVKPHKAFWIRPIGIESSAELAYQRVLLEIEPLADSIWLLVLYDENDRSIQVFSSRAYPDKTQTWSKPIHGNKAYAYLYANEADSKTVDVRISAIWYTKSEPQDPAVYSVQDVGDKNWKPLYEELTDEEQVDIDFYRFYRRQASSIGLLLTSDSLTVTPRVCTAFAIGANIVVTNWHCGGPAKLLHIKSNWDTFWDPMDCKHTLIDFSWDGDSASRDFRCENVIFRNRDLDVVVLEVQPLLEKDQLQPLELNLSKDGAVSGTLVHHSSGSEMLITKRPCTISSTKQPSWTEKTPEVDWLHTCDSQPGASGAPLFDSNGSVFAIHHLGFQYQNGVCDGQNKAVDIRKIVGTLCTAWNEMSLLQQPTVGTGVDDDFRRLCVTS